MASRRDSVLAHSGDEKCRMVHLKTKEECRLGDETIEVWTVELPSKHAEGILRYVILVWKSEAYLLPAMLILMARVVKEFIPGQDAIDLQHLRRFAKPKFLPEHVLKKSDAYKEAFPSTDPWDTDCAQSADAVTAAELEWPASSRPRSATRPQLLHLLICPTRCIDIKDLHDLLLQHPPFCSSSESWAFPLQIKEITVPLLPPTSPEKAAAWSQQYWPTFYRKTNPFGAHPGTILKAEEELQSSVPGSLGVDEALALATDVGNDAYRKGFGIGTGCVIIERVDGHPEIVAVAGDARFMSKTTTATNQPSPGPCQGNIMGHVVMRAVGMVGRKRLRCASQPVTKAAAKAESNFTKGGLHRDEKARDAFFLDQPVLPLEQKYFDQDNLKPDGYLCLKLEVFLTHEPCTMCSMALVHSRVGRVIFRNRMLKTGGLTAEAVRNDSGPVGLGYGLCWRKELNWQFMCWEYIPATEEGTTDRKPSRGRQKVKDSFEKYIEDGNEQTSKVANVAVSSFASIHV